MHLPAGLLASFRQGSEDPVDRLARATVFSGTTLQRDTIYGLDQTGNRTNVIGAACSGTYAMSSTAPPDDSQMNQYSTTPCDSRSYDNNGNLVNRSSAVSGPATYQYDHADRLVLVQALGFQHRDPRAGRELCLRRSWSPDFKNRLFQWAASRRDSIRL
jgi:hypothetical protein